VKGDHAGEFDEDQYEHGDLGGERGDEKCGQQWRGDEEDLRQHGLKRVRGLQPRLGDEITP
jgi:hypothetical protein